MPHPLQIARRRMFRPRFARLAVALSPLLAALAVLVAVVTGCGRQSGPAGSQPLVIGMELSYPPFETLDAKGEPTGIGVDLARELATSLHRELRIENIPFDALITALKTGRIQLIISSMTVTPERAESIDFSDPYVSTGIAILAGAKTDIQGIGDLDKPGRTVVTKSATTGYLYAQAHFKQAAVRVLGDGATCALEVAQGKADAFIFDQIAVYRFHQKHPDTTRALLEPFQRENWAIAIQKGNGELRQGVNAFLTDFKARRGIEKLNEKYLGGDKEAFAKMGFPFGS